MTYSGSYAVLLVLHLLTVAFVVGPAAVAGVVSSRHVRERRADALRSDARTTRTYTLATLVTVVLGSALVSVSGGSSGAATWSMGQFWVSGSYALWLVAVLLVMLLVVPSQERAATAIENEAETASLQTRIGIGAGVAMLCYVAIVALMVTKPGA